MRIARSIIMAGVTTVAIGVVADSALAEPDFVLIDRNLRAQPVGRLVLDDELLTFRDEQNQPRRRDLDQCLALTQATVAQSTPPSAGGVLLVSDGQRLPGSIATGAHAAEANGQAMIAWSHPWLGRVNVPLDRVSAVTFHPGVPVPTPGDSEVVVLLNGDRLEGFIVELGDPIVIEVDGAGERKFIRIPLERAAGVALASSRTEPTGRRVWLHDGSLLDARRLAIGDDGYVRLETNWGEPGDAPIQVRLADISAILFDPLRMVPLAGLDLAGLEGPPLRYDVPEPRVLDEHAPLGLGRIEYRGPLLARYTLPAGCRRFGAEAHVPEGSRVWGDFELVIRDEDEEVYRRRFNGDEPTDVINVPVTGSELTIELTPGANGPIHDRVVLTRALLLK